MAKFEIEKTGEFSCIVKVPNGETHWESYQWVPTYYRIEINGYSSTYPLLKIENYNYRQENGKSGWWLKREYAESLIGEKAILAGEKYVRGLLDGVKRDIINAQKHPCYEAMKKIVEEKVMAFKNDFAYHDCILLGRGIDRFVWIVRESGTHMIGPDKDSSLGYLIEDAVKNKRSCYYGDQNGLYEINLDHLESYLPVYIKKVNSVMGVIES